MSRASPYIVAGLILKGNGNLGERLPILIDRKTRLPMTRPMEWVLSLRRSAPVAALTIERELRYLGNFDAWLRSEGLDISDPFSFVDKFTPNRIEASLRPWLGRDESDRKVKKLSVQPEQIRARIDVIRDYTTWTLTNAQRAMSVRTQAKEYIAFQIAKDSIRKSLEDIKPTQFSDSSVEGLSNEDATQLIIYIRPSNLENPWARGSSEMAVALRYRNELIVLLMLAFGPRRGDLLKLYTVDVKTHGSNPTLWIRRRPDDPNDPRIWEPNAKTEERMLPLDPSLAKMLNEYILKYRPLMPNYKKTPYLLLASDNGTPLASRSVNDIFDSLKSKFTGIHPHVLRHTHNDRLLVHCKAARISEKDAASHAMYLNGWLGDNLGIYTRRESRESARRISLTVQRNIFAPVDDVPY